MIPPRPPRRAASTRARLHPAATLARLARRALCGAALVLLAACAATPSAPVKPPAAMHTEGVPELPAATLQMVQRYSEPTGHGFVQWHPSRAQMLVSRRDGATVQVFALDEPMGALRRVTGAAGGESVRLAEWEPARASYLVFARSRGGDEADGLYRMDLPSRQVAAITAPDQRHRLVAWLREPSRAIVASVPLDRTAALGRRERLDTTLSIIDPLQPGQARTLVVLPGSGWIDGSVSPDGRRLAITRYASAQASEVWTVDTTTGAHARLWPAAGDPRTASVRVSAWTGDGRALLLLSDADAEFRELVRLDVASGRAERLSAHIPWNVEAVELSANGRYLAARVNVDGRDELRMFDAVTGAEMPLPPDLPRGGIGRIALHRSLPLLAMVVTDAQGPGQIHVLDLSTLRVVPWTRGEHARSSEETVAPRIVRWTGFDGRTISGILHRPPARFAGRRPVVVVLHGGPESQAKLGYSGRLRLLTHELGVAVLEPNVRGSSGYGKTFLALDNGRLREDAVKDVAAALDWIATDAGLDAGRVAVMGGSYGGYLTLASAVHLGPRIRAAASAVGISHFVSFLERTESYRRDLRRAEYGDERDPDMRAFLHRISPLTQADRIATPLLVAQGRNDPRVPWTESEQIVRRLQQRGAPVWYLLAGNEGHGFARRENADFWFATLIEFLRVHLLR